MDSNVSKNTFSHKFFKLRFVKDKSTVSVKSLLKQELLRTLTLSGQLNTRADLQSISTILEQKIVLSSLEHRRSSSEPHGRVLSKLRIKPIVYSCPMVSLASYLRQPAAIVTENLEDLLTSNRDNIANKAELNLQIKITSSGWINFYLDFKAVASWLERSQLFIEEAADPINLSTPVAAYHLSSENLFPAQYVHARYCSLLRLGAREKLITLKDANFNSPNWQIEKPQSISWLDEEQNLWLSELAEYNLLRQLFIVTDSFASDSNNWLKTALNLSSTAVIFLADCRFLGEVKQKPQKAIARLGLIALTQYWLQRILIEKLKVAAPTEL